MSNNEELLKKLLVTFQSEAEDHLRSLSTLLIELEREPGSEERKRLVETLYRKMHTLKGAAHAVNLLDVGEMCQSLESLLAALKRGEIELGVDLFDRLHAAVDALGRRIFLGRENAATVEGGSVNRVVHESDAPAKEDETVTRVSIPPPPDPRNAAVSPFTPGVKSPASDAVKVPVHVLDGLLLQTEELISAKLMAEELVAELSRITAEFAGRGGDLARAVELARTVRRQAGERGMVDRLAGMVEARSEFEKNLGNRLDRLEKSAEKSLRALSGMVDTLLDDMKKVHLLPFFSLIEPFPKIIRDIARDLGKEVELSCSGGELEIDSRILSELKEPLLHIIRNIVDHGIEKPGERQSNGKPAAGKITIVIGHQDGNRAEMVIADDGRGVDLARIKAAAVKLELLAEEQSGHISDSEALQLIFESGISTSPLITSLSGRGLGLAIVRESLDKLGGHVKVATQPGRGTEFRLVLPLSFATIRGVLVETSGRSCLIPAANVEQTVRVPVAEIGTVENRETITVSGQAVSLARLGRILELPGRTGENPSDHQPVVILSAGDKRIALAVDQVLGVHEVLAKPLGRQLSRVRNVSGATVLGNGRVVPILNVNDLVRSAVTGSAATVAAVPSVVRTRARQPSVLVVEDSITSRTLLKNILEASGYQVTTAIDGSDAMSRLKIEEFDIVVSDVEMPRMDGFELTAAIRRDKRLAGLPVILVTGLESREDKEHGIDVGANAYIVKSSFDQSRLIEVIRKLI
jgi:two-component system, chemotaxis family, sensor kinase CheA